MQQPVQQEAKMVQAVDTKGLQRKQKGDKPFTIENITDLWTGYLQRVKSDKPRMFNALEDAELSLENETILLKVVNNSIIEEFNNSVKGGFIGLIESNINIDEVEIKVGLLDVETSGKKAYYTEEEKFKHLAEKNPLLNTLKEKLNLDFD